MPASNDFHIPYSENCIEISKICRFWLLHWKSVDFDFYIEIGNIWSNPDIDFYIIQYAYMARSKECPAYVSLNDKTSECCKNSPLSSGTGIPWMYEFTHIFNLATTCFWYPKQCNP